MAKRIIYTIKITNWDKHNPHQKKSFKKLLLDNNFTRDAKLRALPMTSRWLFLNLLITCSDMCRDTFEISPNSLRDMLECNRNIDGVLTSLQSLQLLTWKKNAPLLNEKKRNEKELNEMEVTAAVGKPPASTRTETVARGAISEFVECDKSLMNVTHKIQRAWLEAYPSPDWIKTEIKRANIWIASNPKKAPKDFGRFMSSWLSRGFENYRKGIPTKYQTNSEKNANAIGDMWKKVQEGEL